MAECAPWAAGVRRVLPVVLDLVQVRVADSCVCDLDMDVLLSNRAPVKGPGHQVARVVVSCIAHRVALAKVCCGALVEGLGQLLKGDVPCRASPGLRSSYLAGNLTAADSYAPAMKRHHIAI